MLAVSRSYPTLFLGMNLPNIGGGVQSAGESLERGSAFGAALSMMDEIAAWRSLSATSRANFKRYKQLLM